MMNAAEAVATEIRKLAPQRLLIVCGPGNNGGDGMALAFLLSDTMEVQLLLAQPPSALRQPEARWAFSQLDPNRTTWEVYRDPARLAELSRRADLIVDALLGSGIRGDLRPPIRELVMGINRSGKPVLSIDVPTGYGSRIAVRPDVTVALHAKKQGMTRANSGRILVRDIGIPLLAQTEIGPADFFIPYPKNPASSHKGQNGRVLIIAGGPYTGAPLLCAGSAMRTGVDLVRLLTPAQPARAAQAHHPDLIVHPGSEARRLVPEDAAQVKPLLPRLDCILIGPGLGDNAETVEAIETILKLGVDSKVHFVLDADAVAVAGQHVRLARLLRPLVTPHRGEFKEYTGASVPKEEAQAVKIIRQQARRMRSTLLVKGPVDIVSDGHQTKLNRVHHPGMTTGGTGDVLAGLCAGFVAKGMPPFRAACAAAFVNGDAGQRVADRQGGSLLATDLIRELPRVFRTWLS